MNVESLMVVGCSMGVDVFIVVGDLSYGDLRRVHIKLLLPQ